jgi:hypothetical protein
MKVPVSINSNMDSRGCEYMKDLVPTALLLIQRILRMADEIVTFLSGVCGEHDCAFTVHMKN